MNSMDTDMSGSCKNTEEGVGAGAAAGGSAADRDRLQSQAPAQGSTWSLLALARQLIDQGKPALALQAVVVAMSSQGGENAVLQTLHRARELYRNKLQANAAADELASLFAECAITEAQPPNSDPPLPQAGGMPMVPDVDGTSILEMSGRKQIMLDAFSDGSSFICLKCGGLVSNLRREEHLAYWCGKV